MRILLACERSAGHVFPALCFARKFQKEFKQEIPGDKANIWFFATAGFLKKYIQDSGFFTIGKSFGSRNIILEGFWRFIEAIYIITRFRPNKVIGFGGRDSFFLVLLSSLLRADTAIYEPNIKMGKANKVLSLFVKNIFRGFGESNINTKTKVIGIPLRENLNKIDKKKACETLGFDQKPVVFYFGGSQGSNFINNIATKFMQESNVDFQVIHLTGESQYSDIIQLYKKAKSKGFVKSFDYNMETLYSAADIIVCRAGAVTLGEIAYYQLPAILLPHPKAGAHQKDNALYFKERKAALVYQEDNFSFQDFSKSLHALIQDSDMRQAMKDNLGKIKLGVKFEDFCQHTYF